MHRAQARSTRRLHRWQLAIAVRAVVGVLLAAAPKLAEAQALCGPPDGIGPVRINEPYSCGAVANCATPPGYDFANLVGCETTIAPPGMAPDGTGIAPLQPASYPYALTCTCQAIRISDGDVLEFTDSPSTALVVNDNAPPIFSQAVASVAPPPGAASPVIRQVPVETASGGALGIEVRSGESLSISLSFSDPDGDEPQIEVTSSAPLTTIDTQITWVADHTLGPAIDAVVWPVAYPGDRRGQALPITIFVGDPYPRLLALEVSQGIQSWRNHVPLVAGRRTFVRAALQSSDGAIATEKAGGVLVGFDELGAPLSPILPPLGTQSITVLPAGAAIDRARLDAMPLFELPPSWVKEPGTGGVRRLLFVRSDVANPMICRETTSNPFVDPENDCIVAIEIGPPNPLDVQVIELDVTLTTSALTVSSIPRDTARRVRARLLDALPVSSVSVRPPRRHAFEAIDGPEALTRRVLNELRRIRKQDGCRSGCDRVYVGSIPNGGIDGGGMPLDVINAFNQIDGRAAEQGRGLVAWAIDREGGGGRFTVAHEVAHLFDVVHPAAEDAPLRPDLETVWSTCSGATDLLRSLNQPFPWIFPNESLGEASYIGPVENSETGTPDPLLENWGLSTLALGGTGDTLREPLVVEPESHFAEMGSCAQFTDPEHGWMSDVSWTDALNGIAARLGNPSTPLPSTPDAQLRVSGLVDFDAGEIEILDVEPVASDYVPLDYEEGDFILGVFDAIDNLLGFVEFEVLIPPIEQDTGTSGGLFDLVIPNDPTIDELAFVHASDITTVLASRTRSAHPPTVTVVQPNGGEVLGAGSYHVQWTGTDLDLDPLVYDVQYSDDAGASWQVLATGLTQTTLSVDLTTLPGSSEALVRVSARDGFDVGRDTSDAAFTVAGKTPDVSVIRPAPGDVTRGTQVLVLESEVLDVEDGDLDGGDVVWSSSLDGVIGNGRMLALGADTLTPGSHLLTVTGTDSDGNPTAEQVAITVEAAFASADLDVDLAADAHVRVGETFGQTVTVQNDGPDEAGDLVLTLQSSALLSLVSTTTEDGACVEIASGLVECSLAPLTLGEQAQVDLTWLADAEGDTLVRASAASNVEDPDPSNDAATTTVPEPGPGATWAGGALAAVALGRWRRRVRCRPEAIRSCHPQPSA